MVHQNELCQPKDFDLYLAAENEGEVRTRQNFPGQIQRQVITDRSGGQYMIQAVLRSCVHGQWDPTDNRPASLIVVDYKLVALSEGARFSSMHTRFSFSDESSAAPSDPIVKSFGPFEKTARWNLSTEGQTKTPGINASLAPEVAGTKVGELSYHRDTETRKDRLYFDRGTSGLEYNIKDQKAHTVWWNISQNRSQDNGIPVNFRVAMLIERKSMAKFKGTFEITARGGFGYRVQELINRFILKTDVDDDIIFDPQAEALGNDLEDAEGNAVLIDSTKLGSLATRHRLIGLTEVEGLSSLPSNGGTRT
jgi:hypothetical protein